MQTLKTLFLMATLSCFAIISVGCNTISGLGEDMQAAGTAISNKAEEIKEGDD